MKYDTADDGLVRISDAYKYWKNKAVTMKDHDNSWILRMMLDGVPSAEPKTGKWEDNYPIIVEFECLRCGNCHGLAPKKPFCCFCGAKMEEEER